MIPAASYALASQLTAARPLIEAGLVATCGAIEFELGWATRTAAEFGKLRADRATGYEWLATHDEDWRRAIDVQAALWRSGQIRAVGFPDLLVAAVTEREGATVLHYDGDFDLVARITGQPMQWVVPRKTVPKPLPLAALAPVAPSAAQGVCREVTTDLGTSSDRQPVHVVSVTDE